MLKPLASLLAACVVAVTLALHPFGIGDRNLLAAAATPPLVGFSFSPRVAAEYGQSPRAALATLLDRFQPDLVRLPVYWDAVEPARGTFNFASVDDLLRVVARHNSATTDRTTRVILVAGVRNMAYPEVWLPTWIAGQASDDLTGVLADPDYKRYLHDTFTRYAHHPLLAGWQVENEALDDVLTTVTSESDIPADYLREEMAMLHAADPEHAGAISTYNSSTLSLDMVALSPDYESEVDDLIGKPAGHPFDSLEIGDALGLDVYAVTGSTSLADAPARQRIDWKVESLKYWSGQVRAQHKQLWITEMQGAPWWGHTDFTTDDLLYSARAYRHLGASVVLLWGAESWLTSDGWMEAATAARDLLRG